LGAFEPHSQSLPMQLDSTNSLVKHQCQEPPLLLQHKMSQMKTSSIQKK
jgi:hypothetical protein